MDQRPAGEGFVSCLSLISHPGQISEAWCPLLETSKMKSLKDSTDSKTKVSPLPSITMYYYTNNSNNHTSSQTLYKLGMIITWDFITQPREKEDPRKEWHDKLWLVKKNVKLGAWVSTLEEFESGETLTPLGIWKEAEMLSSPKSGTIFLGLGLPWKTYHCTRHCGLWFFFIHTPQCPWGPQKVRPDPSEGRKRSGKSKVSGTFPARLESPRD